METINIWADLSSEAINAQQKAAPGIHVQNAILDIDVAKIRKDAEEAIRADVEYLQNDTNAAPGVQKYSITPEVEAMRFSISTHHGSGATFDAMYAGTHPNVTGHPKRDKNLNT